MDKENIIKGIEYEDGQYVILTPDEIEAAYPVSTQTIGIEAFVPVAEPWKNYSSSAQKLGSAMKILGFSPLSLPASPASND
jgi:hypothetical protein